jgi:hypothetical protein
MSQSENMKAYVAGAPIPAVDPADIRCVRQCLKDFALEHPAPTAQEGANGIDIRLFDQVCSPGANVPAVLLRNTMIELLLHLKLLTPWLRGDDLDDAVLQVAASFPIASLAS